MSPFKDKDAKLAYQREWYAAHRQRVIAKVRRRKWERYGGVCVNCGRPTWGQTKNVPPPEYCGKPECRSAQAKANRAVYSAAGKIGRAKQLGKKVPDVIWDAETGKWEEVA